MSRFLRQTSWHVPIALFTLFIATAAEAAPCTVAAPLAANAKTDVVYDPSDSSMKACVAGSWVVLASGGGGAVNLGDLSDVSLTSPTLNHVLLFNGANWVNSAVSVTESDPQVGTLTSNKWCAANAGATAIDCTQNAPSGGSSQWTDGTSGAIYYNGGSIGIGTASPANALHVVDASSNRPIVIADSAYSYGFGYGFASDTTHKLSFSAVSGNPIINFNGGRLAIRNAGVEVLAIQSSGRIGVNDTGPDAAIEISANGSTANDLLNVSSNDETDGDLLTVSGTGNVGIGTTNPANYKLVIEASLNNAAKLGLLTTGRSGTEYPSVGYNVRFGTTAGAYAYEGTDTASMIRFNSGKVETFTTAAGAAGNSISFTTGPYVAQGGTTWTAGSDVRLKENIAPISVLDKLDAFRAVSFDWKETGKHDVGVIAQEMINAFPEVVDKGDDDLEAKITSSSQSKWGVQYDKLGALALQAAKELKSENDNLKAENTELRKALDQLRGRVEKLEYER